MFKAMQPSRGVLGSEAGAIVIQVAVALLALIAFSALTIDYGVLWVSRAQAQNAADAGALAGAVALTVNNFNDRGNTGAVKSSAVAAARSNQVWLAAPDVQPATDVNFPPGSVCADAGTANFSAAGVLTPCIEVDVYRTLSRSNALPTYFAPLFGKTSQEVLARAWGQAAPANSTDCARPWAIPDRWSERNPSPLLPWRDTPPLSTFTLGPPADSYTAPTAAGTSPGYKVLTNANSLSDDYGRLTTLVPVPPVLTNISPGNFIPVQFPGRTYAASIAACSGTGTSVGDLLTRDASATAATAATEATRLRNLDPTAVFDVVTKTVVNSCATAAPPCGAFSPRIVVLPVINVFLYESTRANPTPTFQVENFVGFFINQITTLPPTGVQITGYLVPHPGLLNAARPKVNNQYAFLRKALLVPVRQ